MHSNKLSAYNVSQIFAINNVRNFANGAQSQIFLSQTIMYIKIIGTLKVIFIVR